jgi:hypothetical protein
MSAGQFGTVVATKGTWFSTLLDDVIQHAGYAVLTTPYGRVFIRSSAGDLSISLRTTPHWVVLEAKRAGTRTRAQRGHPKANLHPKCSAWRVTKCSSSLRVN